MPCKTSLSRSLMSTVIQTENQVTVPDGFHGDDTLLTFYETLSFSLLVMSAKLIIFNVMKSPLRLALLQFYKQYIHFTACLSPIYRKLENWGSLPNTWGEIHLPGTVLQSTVLFLLTKFPFNDKYNTYTSIPLAL